MNNKKVTLKKISKENNSTVKTLDCHCGCEGKPVSAVFDGYMLQYL